MKLFSDQTKSALQKIANCTNAVDALSIFRQEQKNLKDWIYLYAIDDTRGSVLLDQFFLKDQSDHIGFSTVFSGKSLFVLDKKSANNDRTEYRIGKGIYFDSNAASVIRSLAYKSMHSNSLKKKLRLLEKLKIDYKNINPFLYLWEVQSHFASSSEAYQRSIETFAAMHTLKLISGPLDEVWGEMYRKYFIHQAEQEAKKHISKFICFLNDGLKKHLDEQFNIVLLILLHTKILELSSRKSPKHKFEQLLKFMDEKLSAIMFRELPVCADILFHEARFSTSKKLNSLEQKKDPIKDIKNCAWDLYLFRALDLLSNVNVLNANGIDIAADFYIPSFVTFDRDALDIFNFVGLRGLALHPTSMLTQPFPDALSIEWLFERVENKEYLCKILSNEEGERRYNKKNLVDIDALLKEETKNLLNLLN